MMPVTVELMKHLLACGKLDPQKMVEEWSHLNQATQRMRVIEKDIAELDRQHEEKVGPLRMQLRKLKAECKHPVTRLLDDGHNYTECLVCGVIY
jgi:hypothetical protein